MRRFSGRSSNGHFIREQFLEERHHGAAHVRDKAVPYLAEVLERMTRKNLVFRRYSGGGGGFTLIELMVVIGILGILAAIAIPQFISYRRVAIDAQLKSDLRNAAIAVEGYFAKRSVYPSNIDELQAFGFHPTSGVTVTIAVLGPNSYTLTAAKPGGTQPNLTFSNTSGSIQYLQEN